MRPCSGLGRSRANSTPRLRGVLVAVACSLLAALAPPSSACDGAKSACSLARGGRPGPERQLAQAPRPSPTIPIDPWEVAKSNGLTGVGAVAQLFMEFGDLSGTDLYWKETLDWIVDHAIDASPGKKWESYVNFPDLERIFGHPTTAWNAQALAEGWLRCGNIAYLNMARAGMQWLVAEKIPMSNYLPGKSGWVYLELDPRVPSVHFYSNTVFNQVGIGQGALDVYRATQDSNARSVALGVADALVSCADPQPTGHAWRTWWPANPAPSLLQDTTHVTYRCGGQPGIAEFLIGMAQTFPTAVTYRTYARGALDWLVSMAVPVPESPYQPAYKWPGALGADPDSTADPFIGHGAAGIGRALLMGSQAFGDSSYLQYARGAGNWLLHVATRQGGTTRWMGDNSWCRGDLGIAQFLGNLYDDTSSQDYALAYLQAYYWLKQISVDTFFGKMFPLYPGGDYHMPDFFTGFAGIANYHFQHRSSLWTTQPALEVNLNALAFLANSARREGNGYAWTMHIPFGGYAAAMGPLPELAPLPRQEDGPSRSRESASVFPSPRGMAIWPNPTRDEVRIAVSIEELLASAAGGRMAGGTRGLLVVRIVDVGGRVVRELRSPASAAEQLEWVWDTHGSEGRPVPQGMYFAQVLRNGVPVGEPARVAVLR